MDTEEIYKSPTAEVEKTDKREVVDADLGMRWGRIQYMIFCAAIIVFIPGIVFQIFGNGNESTIISNAFTAILLVWISRNRLRDFGKNPWYSLAFIVPLINYVVYIVLCFVPGSIGANKFGRR